MELGTAFMLEMMNIGLGATWRVKRMKGYSWVSLTDLHQMIPTSFNNYFFTQPKCQLTLNYKVKVNLKSWLVR